MSSFCQKSFYNISPCSKLNLLSRRYLNTKAMVISVRSRTKVIEIEIKKLSWSTATGTAASVCIESSKFVK